MPATPAPTPMPAPAGRFDWGTWTIEKRQILGAALGLLCVGIIIGARIGRSTDRLLEEAAQQPWRLDKAPCADCEERRIKEQRARSTTFPPDRPLPGNVPPVPAAGDAVTANDGMATDTSKAHVADATFLAPGGDGSAVPGM